MAYATDHIDRGAFAGAVWAQESKNFTRLDLKGEGVDDTLVSKGFRKLLDREGGWLVHMGEEYRKALLW